MWPCTSVSPISSSAPHNDCVMILSLPRCEVCAPHDTTPRPSVRESTGAWTGNPLMVQVCEPLECDGSNGTILV